MPDRQVTLEVQRQTGDALPHLEDPPGGWLRNFLRVFSNASQHPLGCCALPPPPRHSRCSQSALYQPQPGNSPWWEGGKSSTSKRKSVFLLLGQHTPTTLCVVYDHGVNQTEWIKRIFSFTVRSLGLLKGRHSKDEHAGTKVHHYCDGCHLEVLVEKPAFYGIQHWTFHGLLPGRRLIAFSCLWNNI